jgi:hypothetical protein
VKKEEIIAAIKECMEKLGHAPSFAELRRETKVTKRAVRRHFLHYTDALKECGLERRGAGYEVSRQDLLDDWARLVRTMGRIPSIHEYEFQSEYSIRPMLRWFRNWRSVPQGMMEYLKKEGLDVEYGDVMDVMAKGIEARQRRRKMLGPTTDTPPGNKILEGQPIYGTPLLHEVMSYAPTNEMGVMVLFAAEAKRLGFRILRLQAGCPDCEAMREIAPGRWQRVRIEFEFESRNFLAHGHKLEDCDLIVCWEHNWQHCQMEVMELKEVISDQRGALSEDQDLCRR